MDFINLFYSSLKKHKNFFSFYNYTTQVLRGKSKNVCNQGAPHPPTPLC